MLFCLYYLSKVVISHGISAQFGEVLSSRVIVSIGESMGIGEVAIGHLYLSGHTVHLL